MNIKFNHLLIGSLVFVIIGYAVQATLAVQAVNKANISFTTISDTFVYSSWLDSVELDATVIEQDFSRLNAKLLPSMSKTISDKKENLTSPIIQSAELTDLTAAGIIYYELQNTRLSLVSEIGFPGEPGLIDSLFKAEEAIDSNELFRMALFEADKDGLLTAIKRFSDLPSKDNQVAASAAFEAFLKKLNEFGLKEDVMAIVFNLQDVANKFMKTSLMLNNTINQIDSSYLALTGYLATVKKEIESRKTQLQEKSNNEIENTLLSLMTTSLILCLLVSVIVGKVIRNIVRAMKKSQFELSLLEKGDLTRRQKFNKKRNDAIDQVANSMDKMAIHLSGVVKNVQRSAQELDGIVQDVNNLIESNSTSNKDNMLKTLSLTASTEELSVTIRQIDSDTDNFYQSSLEAERESQNGTTLVSEVCSKIEDAISEMAVVKASVEKLEKQSSEIDSVTELINDIANQTNLLALNAAIEAARAGESGRGFAVVADEVRNLAEKTVSATSQITKTILILQNESKDAINSVNQGEKTLSLINDDSLEALTGIKNIETIVRTNSESTKSITTAIGEIVKTVNGMAQDTEIISQGLQDENKSSNKLVSNSDLIKEKSEELSELVMSFKT